MTWSLWVRSITSLSSILALLASFVRLNLGMATGECAPSNFWGTKYSQWVRARCVIYTLQRHTTSASKVPKFSFQTLPGGGMAYLSFYDLCKGTYHRDGSSSDHGPLKPYIKISDGWLVSSRSHRGEMQISNCCCSWFSNWRESFTLPRKEMKVTWPTFLKWWVVLSPPPQLSTDWVMWGLCDGHIVCA